MLMLMRMRVQRLKLGFGLGLSPQALAYYLGMFFPFFGNLFAFIAVCFLTNT